MSESPGDSVSPPEPKVLIQVTAMPDGSVEKRIACDPIIAVTLLMQMVVELCVPRPRMIVPPTGVGGFRNLFGKSNGR